ncbi:MAG: ATP-binding protein [Oligoflexales bacterium]|nr:ATP-binding protein [Oligoflexales bacterium]
MYRTLLEDLGKWHRSSDRKSLILSGSRQVGKTWLVREFARLNNLELIEINFEETPKMVSIFAASLKPEDIVTAIELTLNRRIILEKSLLFFDEVQQCPIAITALKHFTDHKCRLPVIATGSYLGLLEGKTEGISQPIGYVEELKLFPMNFDEYLLATDPHPALAEAMENHSKLTPVVHERLLSLYREYLFVGGLPQVVATWLNGLKAKDSLLLLIQTVRALQKKLLAEYKADFAKYHPRDALNIARTWEFVAENLSRSLSEVKRFTFKDKIPGKRGYGDFANYFIRLEACGLIYRSFVTDTPVYPLKSQKKDSLFKCFYFDSGLLLSEMDFEYTALNPDKDIIYKGPIAENFIAGELVRLGISPFSYVKSNSTAEIEFLIQKDGKIIPIEVKNNNPSAKSLAWFMKEFDPVVAIKFSNSIGSISEKVKHYPIYLCHQVLKKTF